jgi:hypothetical protein
MTPNARRLIVALFLAASATVGCQTVGGPTGVTPDVRSSTQDWNAFSAQFLEWYFAAHPNIAVWAGRHEYDGRLPDWSAAGFKGLIDRLHTEREVAERFRVDGLGPAQRFEREMMLAKIDGELFWLESAQWPFRSPAFYGWALDPAVYVSREYAPLGARMRAYIDYANGIPAASDEIRHNLRTPLPRSYVQIGHIVFGGLARFYEQEVPAIFRAVDDPRMREDFRAANDGAIRAMRALDEWLTAQEPNATEDFALGGQKFEEMLRATERVDVPLERLKQIGEADLDRNLKALHATCMAMDPRQTDKVCVAKVLADKPSDSPVDLARRQLDELRTFVIAHSLVSIPGPEQATTKESPPYMRWNAAYIDIPGPYERNLPSTYYIAPPDPNWTKAEQASYIPAKADLLFISAHEVWPGHFLQFLHSNRTPSKLGQVFISYAFAEGWAHYSEEMMWEAGLGNGDPETHVGQLVNALLRDVRYLSAIGLHTAGMTVAESEAMFREKAFQDAGNARQQAARGTFDPAYGNYTLGKLMIRKLREEWTANHGGRSSWKAFHDELLDHGAPPIPLVRRAMLGEEAGPPL